MASHNPKQVVAPLYLVPPPPPHPYDPLDKQIFIVCGLVFLVIISSICMLCISNRWSHDHDPQNNADGEHYDVSSGRTSGSWDDGSHPNYSIKERTAKQEQGLSTVTVERQAAEEEEYCAVCLEGMKEGDECGVVKRCEHMYHKPCIHRWLLHSDRCPLCRLHIWTHHHLITRYSSSSAT